MSAKKKVALPTAEDFTNRKIRKKVLAESIQHPATLYSAAIAVLSGIYMGLVSFDQTAFAVALGGGLLSLASWVYNYFIRGDKIAKKHVEKLLAKRREYKEQQGKDIERECWKAGFSEGAEAAKELKDAYIRLDTFLKEKLEKRQTLTASRFLTLAEESYQQGIQFLGKALSLYQAIARIDERKLNRELRNWEKELKRVEQNDQKGEEYKAVLTKALREKIRSHNRRLELYAKRKETLSQVLAQCEILEATLDATYLEVVDLVEDDTVMQRTNVASNLEKAVAAARRVEDRLRGLEKEDAEDDQYLEENR